MTAAAAAARDPFVKSSWATKAGTLFLNLCVCDDEMPNFRFFNSQSNKKVRGQVSLRKSIF